MKEDFRAAAIVLQALGQQNAGLTEDALNAIEKCEYIAIPATVSVPYAGYAVSEHYVTICVSGTRNFLQWILHILGSSQRTDSNFPGQVNAYFAATASSLIGAIGEDIIALLPTRKLVCLGHSFGGAVAQLLLTYFGPHAPLGSVAIVMGSPRVGNLTFASAVDGKCVRIEDTLDPVIQLPPATWFGVGSPWNPFPVTVAATYVHGGSPFTLDSEGGLTIGEFPLPLEEAWVQVKALDCPSHQIGEYARRLQLEKEPPVVEFDQPKELELVAEFMIPNVFLLGGIGVATVQGVIYFQTNEEPAGWQESWFLDGTPANMQGILQNLLTKRASCLAGNCSIIAYKSSVVDPPPAVRQSILKILDTPIIGGGTSIKSLNPVQTNETMDAIDFSVASTLASRKICFFRGVPDFWIAGSVLSDLGRQALGLFQAYIKAAQDATLGLRIFTRNAGGGRKPNVAIRNVAPGGLIKIEATAHGYPANPAFYQVTLRGIRSNPMLNGKWKAQTVDVNNFVLLGSQRFQGGADNDGSSQLYLFGVDPVASYQFSRVSTRKTGKVFNTRRGKRSPRLLHH